jgi:hypothetical protein
MKVSIIVEVLIEQLYQIYQPLAKIHLELRGLSTLRDAQRIITDDNT